MLNPNVRRALATASLLFLTASLSAQSGTLTTTTSVTVDPTPTTWMRTATIRRFNPAQGRLVGLEFRLQILLDGVLNYENLSSSPASVNLDFRATLEAMRPDGSVILDVSTGSPFVTSVAPFDGTNDFAGPSSASWSTSLAQSRFSSGLLLGGDVELFTGNDLLDLVLQVSDETVFQGGSPSFSSTALQEAGAFLEVTYRYDPDFREFCFGDGGPVPGCTPCPCGNEGVELGGCINSAGTSARLRTSGTNFVTGDFLGVELAGATPDTFAVLISGPNTLPANPASPCFVYESGLTGGGLLDGLRCLGGGVTRLGTRAIDLQGNVGETNAGWGAGNGPDGGLAQAVGVAGGQTLMLQAFYRDDPALSCGSGTNTSNAVAVTFEP